MKTVLLVGVGGFLGSVLRYGVGVMIGCLLRIFIGETDDHDRTERSKAWSLARFRSAWQ